MANPDADPKTGDFPQGPEIGSPVPVFTLPDQHGRPVTVAPDGVDRSLLLFHRSAEW